MEEIPAELVEREGLPVFTSATGRRYVQWEDAAGPDPEVPAGWNESRAAPVGLTPVNAARASGKSPYYNGAVVKHAKFGIGTVQRSEGSGDDLKISVTFPGHGLKTLAVKYANLEVI